MKEKHRTPKEEKIHQLVMENLFTMFFLFGVGLLVGYLLKRNALQDGWLYFIFTVVLFIVIGVMLFLVRVIKGKKNIEKRIAIQEEYLRETESEDE